VNVEEDGLVEGCEGLCVFRRGAESSCRAEASAIFQFWGVE